MQKIRNVTEFQRHLRKLFDEVSKKGIPLLLTRAGRPEAVLISYDDFLHFQALRERDVLSSFDGLMDRMRAQNTALSEEEVALEVAAARSELAD